ncbi:MAG: S9 family peptidase [Candidatus Aminicenantales bacterium]
MDRKARALTAALLAFVLALSSLAFSREKKPFESVDLLKLKNISDPQIEPRGDWVAFVVSQFDENRSMNSELWLVSADGKTLQQITKNPGPDSTPRWSPDGKILAFLSRQGADKSTQVYFYSLANKSLERITHEEGNIRDMKWSPDGRMFAFLKEDAPSEAEKKQKEGGDDGYVVDKDFTHTRLWIMNASGGEARSVTLRNQTVFLFNWSPDGKELAVQASPLPTAEGNEYQSHLGLVDVQTGEEKILDAKINALAAPSFSSDGKWIAYIGPIGSFKERGIAKVISLKNCEPIDLLREYPGNVWDLIWHPREAKVLAAVARGEHNYLLSLDLKDKSHELLEMDHSIIPYWGHHWSVSANGEWVAFLNEKPDCPKEVWIARTIGEDKKQLTFFNDYLKEVSLGSVEAVKWNNPEDDSDVFGIVVKPVGFESGRRYPLVVWLHGGPAYNWGIGIHISNWAQLFASQGHMVFLPNFRGSSGSGMKWMTANIANWGKGPMSDVMAGVNDLIRKGWVDEKQLYIGGQSYGGYLTAWIVTQTNRFNAAFISAGVTNLVTEYALTDEPSFLIGYFNKAPYDAPEIYAKNSPVTYASQAKTPVLIVHGERDFRVPISQGFEFYAALKHYGVPVEMVIYPREGHGVREYIHQLDVIQKVLAWFKKHS